MKFPHPSDLHLGKSAYEFTALDGQEYFLESILRIVDEKQPNVVFIFSDVFDRIVAPTETPTPYHHASKSAQLAVLTQPFRKALTIPPHLHRLSYPFPKLRKRKQALKQILRPQIENNRKVRQFPHLF